MFVIKRDGSKEEFNPKKIENAILKAFNACGHECMPNGVKVFCKDLDRIFHNRNKEHMNSKDNENNWPSEEEIQFV